MPSKANKEKVKQIKKWFDKTDSLFVLRYRGLRVSEANELRVKMKEQDARLRVLKNTLTRIALEDTPKEELTPMIDGPIAVVFMEGEDPAPVARVIKEFSSGQEEFFVLGGMLRGKLVSGDVAVRLATLPSREVLVERAVGQLAAPLSGLVGVFTGLLRNFVGVMHAVAARKESEPAPETETGADAEEAGKQPEQKEAGKTEDAEGKPDEESDAGEKEAETEAGEEGKPEEDKPQGDKEGAAEKETEAGEEDGAEAGAVEDEGDEEAGGEPAEEKPGGEEQKD